MNKQKLQFIALASLAVGLVSQARAVTVDDIAIHGSVSMTESTSDKYNFYGDTANKWDNNVREVTLNGAYRFANGLRVSAQVYSYDIDDYSETVLDFANLDYSVNSLFGIRVGRNKTSVGLYGDAQDLDQVRTFASLPFGVYPKNVRPLAYSDGLNLYGNVPLGRAGSLDYSLNAGRLMNVPSDAPIARSPGSGLTTANTFKLPFVYEGYFDWNTPVDGLRFAYTLVGIPHLDILDSLSTKSVATQPGLNFDPTPLAIDGGYGQGTWDAAFAGTPATTSDYLYEHVFSAEYTWQKWIFAAEYKVEPSHSTTQIPALGVKSSYSKSKEMDSYVQATYQATKSMGLGLYYGYSDKDLWNTKHLPTNLRTTKDLAGVVAYQITKWWLVKAEFHELDGLSLIDSAGDLNPNALTAGSKWNYLILKTTFSF